MRKPRSTIGALALAACLLLLAGCADVHDDDASDAKVRSTGVLLPPPNDLDELRIAQILGVECPGSIHEDTLRNMPQNRADAIDYFASTAQCTDIASVVAATEYTRDFVSPLQYIDAECAQNTTLTVWAHYDDDLIFGSPLIPQKLDADQCVRNLYLTASDAGMGVEHAYQRESGLRAAYDVMRGSAGPWEDRAVHLRNGITLSMTRPADDPRLTLFFLRLPDGGLDAGGFRSTGWASLPRLLDGSISEISTVDGGVAVTAQALTSTFLEFYAAYDPTTVLSHMPDVALASPGDHSDHAATGSIVLASADAGSVASDRVIYAQGYPSESQQTNLGGDELARKTAIFAAYAAHDSSLRCDTGLRCLQLPRFGDWLTRQYHIPHAELVRR